MKLRIDDYPLSRHRVECEYEYSSKANNYRYREMTGNLLISQSWQPQAVLRWIKYNHGDKLKSIQILDIRTYYTSF
jgi:hypothetical protein